MTYTETKQVTKTVTLGNVYNLDIPNRYQRLLAALNTFAPGVQNFEFRVPQLDEEYLSIFLEKRVNSGSQEGPRIIIPATGRPPSIPQEVTYEVLKTKIIKPSDIYSSWESVAKTLGSTWEIIDFRIPKSGEYAVWILYSGIHVGPAYCEHEEPRFIVKAKTKPPEIAPDWWS